MMGYIDKVTYVSIEVMPGNGSVTLKVKEAGEVIVTLLLDKEQAESIAARLLAEAATLGKRKIYHNE